ncbi:MAG: hypothetical protein ACE1Y4_01910, partial [Lysobacterales bacterium]
MNISMHRWAVSFLVTLLVLAIPSIVTAQSGPARVQLERFTNGLKSLHARFDQLVINADGLVEENSSGQLWIA